MPSSNYCTCCKSLVALNWDSGLWCVRFQMVALLSPPLWIHSSWSCHTWSTLERSVQSALRRQWWKGEYSVCPSSALEGQCRFCLTSWMLERWVQSLPFFINAGMVSTDFALPHECWKDEYRVCLSSSELQRWVLILPFFINAWMMSTDSALPHQCWKAEYRFCLTS